MGSARGCEQIVLQKLSASDATDVEQAATQLAHWTNQQATREMVLAHPAVNGAVVRLQVNTSRVQ